MRGKQLEAKNWQIFRVKDVCTIHPGQHIASSDYNLSGIGVGYLTGPSDFGNLHPSISKWTELPKAWSEPGDVLVTVKGAGVGKINIAPSMKVAIGRQLMAVRPKVGVVNQLFLYFIFLTHFSRLQRVALGSTVPGLDKEDIQSLEIPLPPLAEQQRIAAILAEQMADIEAARRAAQAELEAAEALTAAYLRAVFDSDEARGWEKVKLGKLSKTGSGTTPPRGKTEYYENGIIPWVKTGELRDGIIHETEEYVTELALEETSLKLLPEGTLLVAMYGQGQTRGRTGLLNVPATTNQACFAIWPNPGLFEPSYLQLWFRYSYQRLRRQTEGRGGNQPNLNGEVLKDEQVPLPSTETQQTIITKFYEKTSESDLICSIIAEQLQVISTLPGSVLRRAFIGEL